MPAWPPTILRTEPGDEPMPAAPEGVIDVTPTTLADRAQVASIRDYIDRRAHLQSGVNHSGRQMPESPPKVGR